MTSAIVIGGGISGIAAATRLARHEIDAQLFEAGDVLGGRIGACRDGHTGVDLGGRNFTAKDLTLLQLLARYGIEDFSDYHFDSVSVGPGRHVDLRAGSSSFQKVKRLVGNVMTVGPRGLQRLHSIAKRARSEASGHLLASPSWIQLAEETCDVVCSSYFGPAVAESILRPWTLRMMGSEPEEVYLGNLGPFLGKPPGKLMRLSRGMGAFLEAAAAQLNVRLRHTVTNVVIDRGRVTAVEGVDVHGRPFHERADIVVAATPAPIAADLLGGVPALAENLRGVLYRPAATVVAEYTDVAFPGDVGGLFLPRGHVAHHIARYDDANRVRFTFGGVAARRVLESDSLEQLLECGESIFGKFHGKLGRRLSFTGKRWRHGLCAHSWMHHRTLASIREQSEKIRGLVLGGDYFRGNLLESCVTAAHENVDHLVDSGRF